MIPMATGLNILVTVAGIPMYKICCQDWKVCSKLKRGKASIFSRLTNTHKEAAKVTSQEITVASAAPCSSKRGNGPMPKIKNGSTMILTIPAINIIIAGVLVSPVARIAPLVSIGITSKPTPRNHVTM